MLKPNIQTKNSMYLKSPLVDIIKVREFGRFRVYFRYHGTPTHSKSRLGFDSSLAMCQYEHVVKDSYNYHQQSEQKVLFFVHTSIIGYAKIVVSGKKDVYKCLTYVLQWENLHGNEYTCTFFNTSYEETKHSLPENVLPGSFFASLGCAKEHHITSVFACTSTRKAQYVVLWVYFVRPENVVKYDSVRLWFAHIFIFKYVPQFFTHHTVFMLELYAITDPLLKKIGNLPWY